MRIDKWPVGAIPTSDFQLPTSSFQVPKLQCHVSSYMGTRETKTLHDETTPPVCAVGEQLRCLGMSKSSEGCLIPRTIPDASKVIHDIVGSWKFDGHSHQHGSTYVHASKCTLPLLCVYVSDEGWMLFFGNCQSEILQFFGSQKL